MNNTDPETYCRDCYSNNLWAFDSRRQRRCFRHQRMREKNHENYLKHKAQKHLPLVTRQRCAD